MSKRLFYLWIGMMTGLTAAAQYHTDLSGKITNSKSEPIAGASIHILNTSFGAFTNEQGIFELRNIPPGKYALEITAVGYASIIKAFQPSAGQQLNIVLNEAASHLQTVMVTAQKNEEALQQVPFSISALGRKEVQEYRLWNSKDITAIVPNLYSADPGDQRNVTSIRGIVSSSYDPAVATYVDGVNQFGLDTYIAQLFDIERIEVLRGPQGTLYGRNAMGGVINIITRQPGDHADGYAEINAGNHGQQRYSLAFRAPVIKGKLFLGAAGMYEGSNGFYTNEYNNSRFDKQHGIAGNYYLRWLPSRQWNLMLNIKHQLNRNHGVFPLAGSVEDAFANPFKVNQNAITTMTDNTLNGSFSAGYSGKAFNFSSQTTYQSNYRYYNDPIDGDFSPIDGITIINNYGKPWNKVKVWTQELKFNSSPASSSPLKWTAGAYFFYQDNPTKQATRFGRDAAWVGSPDSLYSIINTTKVKRKGFAFYGQATYPLTHKLDLTAGLRFDYEHEREEVHGQYQHDPDPDPVADTQPDTAAAAHFSAFSPKLGLELHLNTNSNLYATYSRGYRTGGLTQLSSDPSQPPLYAYKPEYSNNIEIGIKNNLLNDRLRINLAFFYTKVTDAQVPTLILPEAITITRNAGKLSSRGAELELSSTPLKGLELSYNFGYTHAVYDQLKLSQNGNATDLAGKKQIFTPEFSSMLAAQYSYAVRSRLQLKLIARGEWTALGKQYFDLANTIEQSPYGLFNARLGATIKHVGLFVWARNIGDKKYIAYAYDFGAVHLGNPRTYGLTVYCSL